MKLGLICGYGILPYLVKDAKKVEEWSYSKRGKAEGTTLQMEKGEIIVVYRHGREHQYYPHQVPYLANASALKAKGAERVLALYAVGHCGQYEVGDIVLVEDFICFYPYPTLKNKIGQVEHYGVYPAFSPEFTAEILTTAEKLGIRIKKGGIAHTMPGPRYETKAEVQAITKLGANLLNMTCGFEIPALHEVGLPVSALAIVTNPGAGIGGHRPNHEEVERVMKARLEDIATIVKALLKKGP